MAKHPRDENQGAERAPRASWVVHHGDVLDRLRELPDESVQCVVTSPPYWGLRDYGVDGMIGLEPTLGEHLARLVEVFREVRRVLRDDGCVWLNYGDSYQDKQRTLMPARVALALQSDGWWVRSEIVWAKGLSFCPTYSGSCMPSSVRDRPTDSHEMVYLLSKKAHYYYDQDAVREASSGTTARPETSRNHEGTKSSVTGNHAKGGNLGWNNPSAARNLRTVWCLNPRPYKEAHFATFPPALVRPCILAGTSERGACSECGAPWRRVVDARGNGGHWATDGDRAAARGITSNRTSRAHGADRPAARTTTGWEPTCEHADAPAVPCVVLDPFSGSGTTGAVAVRLGRNYVGIELNPDYLALSRKRIGRAAADVGQGGTVTADEDERAAQLGLWS